MIQIYGSIRSRASRALWAAEEAELPYEHRDIDFGAGAHRAPEFLAINPNGKVPALQDGDLVIFESAAICNYLGERGGERGGVPGLTPAAATSARALYDQWMFFAATELEQPLWSIGKHTFALPARWRLPGMLEVARFEFARAAEVLAGALEGRRFAVGDQFTMADVMLAHTLLWARTRGVPLGAPVLERYLDRMIARPAFQRVLALG